MRILSEAFFIVSISAAIGIFANTMRTASLPLLPKERNEVQKDLVIKDLSKAEAERIIFAETVSVIDLRPAGLFVKSHHPDAMSVPAERFFAMIGLIQEKIPRESGILLYGKDVDGKKVSEIAAVLQVMGYGSIYILSEGWDKDGS